MDSVYYPTREQLEMWIGYLKDPSNILGISLPLINDNWYVKALATIDRVNNSYINGVSCKAAHLFYYLVKDHNFMDGNKRSGIALAYLFFLVNGYRITRADSIRHLAKQVAKSHGGRNKDYWISKIEKEFSYACKIINT